MKKQDVRQTYKIYRMALPKDASLKQQRDFERKIELIRQVNSGWAVISDWAKTGEKEAYVVVRKDKDYAYRRAAYQVRSALSRAMLGGYDVKS